MTAAKNRVKLSKKFLTVNGVRAGVYFSAGPWVDGVNPDLIKLRCKKGCFPTGFRDALAVENKSDMLTDYFESDSIRLLPGHPLYETAKELA